MLYAEPDEYPIVGFQGRTHNQRLTDLGMIWLDKDNENCQHALPMDVKLKMLEDGIPSAEEAFAKLTHE